MEEVEELVEDERLRQEEELLVFVDDFLNSEEFTHRFRNNAPAQETRKRFYCRCTECWLEPEVVMTRSAFVRKAQQLYRIQERFDKLLKIKNAKKIRKVQDAGIQIIRDKIAEAKKAYWCHKKERDLVTKNKREQVLDDLRDLYDVDVKHTKITSPVVTKVLVYKKIKRFNERSKKQRTVVLVRKILHELKKGKTVKDKPRAKKSVEEKQLVSVEVATPSEDEVLEEETLDLSRPVTPTIVAQEKDEPVSFQRKVDPILPYIPIVNTRKRYTPGEPPQTDEVLDDLTKIVGKYKDRMRYELAKELLRGKEYNQDLFFRTSPGSITFQSFKNGNVYVKKLRVYNGGTITKRCVFKRFKLDDAVNNQFEVEAVGVHVLAPGMHFEIGITFSPQDVLDVAKGSVVFVTYTLDSDTFLQFSCRVICLPLSSTVSVKPRTINFDPMPIWEAKVSNTYKNLTIQNLSNNKCLVAITKVKSFGDTEDYLDEKMEEFECADDDYWQKMLTGTYNAGAFSFSSQSLTLPANGKKTVKIRYRNIDYVGSHHEEYCVSTFEESGANVKCLGTCEITVTAEITGKFIEVEPLTIDFDVCAFNSVYHLSFKVTNTSNIPHCVVVKFPSSLKKYLWSDAHKVMIQGGVTNAYQLKFIPRSEIAQCSKYYDSSTHILEFPVYVSMMSKRFASVPPCIMIVVAVLSEANGLSLSSYDTDMGHCTTAETVFTHLTLTNTSYVFQVFGFVDLPPCLQVSPNYGFGELLPLESKTLTLSLSPDVKERGNANMPLSYTIKVETLKSLGGIAAIKEKFRYQLVKKLLVRMEKAMKQPPLALFEDMRTLVAVLHNNPCLGDDERDGSVEVTFEQSSSQSVSDSSLEMVGNNKLTVIATVVDSLCDLSFQHVEFPDIPCGSYAMMSIHLRARTGVEDTHCWCHYDKSHLRPLSYTVRFEVVGDCDEFSVEPTCGVLTAGQMIKLNVIARPELSQKDVVETARRLGEEETLLPNPEPAVDSYRVEIETWKYLEAYFLKGQFCCTIRYASNDFQRRPEQLYFVACCKVIRPSFVHNLRTQHIDFGFVPVGQPRRKVIEIQNISEAPIHPTVSLLSPTGFFTVPYLRDLELAPEHVLHLPLTCNPDAAKEVLEHFELRDGSTIYPLIVSAEGALSDFAITPDFLVCRLEAALGAFAECPLEINNRSRASLSINFVKICEVEGEVEPPPSGKNIPGGKNIKAEPAAKVEKFSNALTDEELNLIAKFKKKPGASFFDVSGSSKNVEPSTKIVVKVVFGDPMKAADSVLKGKTDKKDKTKPKGKSPAGPKKYYVVKYNLMMGTTTFVKDIIIIGTFV